MKKTIPVILVFLLYFPISTQAQTQKTILQFDIIEANNNGRDDSELYIQKQAYVKFYKEVGDTIMNLAIVFPNDSTFSYGTIRSHPHTSKGEYYLGNTTQKGYYQWYFFNSYDDEQGFANIEFWLVHQDANPYCIIKIITQDKFEILTYKGYFDIEESGKEVESEMKSQYHIN